MDDSSPLAVAQRIWEHWARGDYAHPEFYDPEMVYLRGGDGLPGEAGTWQGFDEVWPAVATYLAAWEDISQTAERFIEIDEERVLVLDRQRGRGAKSGIEVDHRLGHLVTVRDRKVVRLEAYWDRRDAFAAAGIEPENGGSQQ